MMKVSVGFLILFVSAAQAKELKIVSQEFMPIAGAGPDGKLSAGAHYEVAKIMCEKGGFKCSFDLLPLDRAMAQVKAGEAHMFIGLAKNPEREEFLYFPPAITQVGYTFFVKKGEAGKYTKLDDFKSKSVGVQISGATGKDLIEQNKKLGGTIKIMEEVMSDTAPKKLAMGRYPAGSAVYCARAVCMHQAAKEGLDIEPVSFDGKLQAHSFGISKKAVTPVQFEEIKKALVEAMKTEAAKKAITSNNLKVHPESTDR